MLWVGCWGPKGSLKVGCETLEGIQDVARASNAVGPPAKNLEYPATVTQFGAIGSFGRGRPTQSVLAG